MVNLKFLTGLIFLGSMYSRAIVNFPTCIGKVSNATRGRHLTEKVSKGFIPPFSVPRLVGHRGRWWKGFQPRLHNLK